MSKYWKFILIFLLIFLGKLSGFFKDILITFYHGVSIVTDSYFLSNSISSVLYMAVYSAIPMLLVPIYSRLLVEGNGLGVNRELSAAISFFFFISVCIAIFVFGAANYLVDIFSGDIEGRVKELAVGYLSIMAMTFALSTLVSFLNSIQTVNKIVIPSYIVPIVNNLVFCVGLYFFSSADDFNKVLMLGVLAWIILLVINYLISRKSFSFERGAAFSFFVDKNFMFLFLPAVIAFYIEQVNGFVGVYFASELGVGAISVFAYSNKLNMIFLSVFLVFLTASLFPRIAAVSVRNDQAELYVYLIGCVRWIVICSIPAVIYMNFYSVEIVRILFQRGNFMNEDVAKVASVFSVVLLALPFCLVRDVMNRVFFSHGNTLIPVLLSFFSLSINFSLSYAVYQQYGLVGLAASGVVSTVFNSFFVLFLVQRKIKFDLLAPCLKILALSGGCGVFAYYSLDWLHVAFPNYWLILFIPFFIVYFACLLLFRVKEAQFLNNLLRRRFA
ncbi:murein biosynthesis integral membrane protein MurJ [Metapseudomonas furukawaii]